MKLFNDIGLKYQSLTANEKRIFDLMSEDVKAFALQSIGEVAAKLDISKTTLMRFAKSCGFKGYADFKKALQKEVLLDTSPARKLDRVITGDYDINPKILVDQELKNIEATFGDLSEKDLADASEIISTAKEIHTLSWGVSKTIAEIFSLRMKLMGIRCNTITRNHGTLLEECSLIKSGELVLFFELPPYNVEMIDAVKSLKERGCTIIGITDSPRSPCAEYSNLSFYCATGAMVFGNSLTGPLFWVNLVSSLVIYRKKDEVMGSLKEQQKYFDDERHYHHAFLKQK